MTACVSYAPSTAPSPPGPGAGFGPAPVTPHEPRTEAWAALAADLTPGVESGAANPCNAGEPRCLEAVVAEMQARTDALGCDHAAPFAFTYLRTTRGVEEHVSREGFFDDPAEIAHLDALFAVLYFHAIDNWRAGRHDEVPPAWRIAFDAADEERVTAAVDVLLGMNAHIGCDLTYAVAQQLSAGPALIADDPSDFFRVDDVIDVVREPMLARAATRYDPELVTLTDMLLPAGTEVDATALISHWREQAYEFGVRLAAAENPACRRRRGPATASARPRGRDRSRRGHPDQRGTVSNGRPTRPTGSQPRCRPPPPPASRHRPWSCPPSTACRPRWATCGDGRSWCRSSGTPVD